MGWSHWVWTPSSPSSTTVSRYSPFLVGLKTSGRNLHDRLLVGTRVSSKQIKQSFGSKRNTTKQDLFRLYFGLFCYTKNKEFFLLGLFRGFEPTVYRNNRNKQNCFETNQNNPKFYEKCQNNENMLPVKLFQLVFCLFWFNQSVETLCFGIEAKQPKQMFCFGKCQN